MIGVFLRFRFEDDFDEHTVRTIAETTRANFEGMPGLRSKTYTFSSEKREAVDLYVWNSEDTARHFYTDEFMERVTDRYGVRPTVEFFEIATIVENP